jgi:hypothetical protein
LHGDSCRVISLTRLIITEPKSDRVFRRRCRYEIILFSIHVTICNTIEIVTTIVYVILYQYGGIPRTILRGKIEKDRLVVLHSGTAQINSEKKWRENLYSHNRVVSVLYALSDGISLCRRWYTNTSVRLVFIEGPAETDAGPRAQAEKGESDHQLDHHGKTKEFGPLLLSSKEWRNLRDFTTDPIPR